MFSDDDDPAQKVKQEERQQKRFGRAIRPQNQKYSNFFRIIVILSAIMLIPLQIVLKTILREKENLLIIKLQGFFDLEHHNVLGAFFPNIYSLDNTLSCLYVGIFLFLAFDSLIAFKITFLYCIGIYIMVMLKMMYESPRPFWMSSQIHTYNGLCMFDFGSPSFHIFNLGFFWVNVIVMYFSKYTV